MDSLRVGDNNVIQAAGVLNPSHPARRISVNDLIFFKAYECVSVWFVLHLLVHEVARKTCFVDVKNNRLDMERSVYIDTAGVPTSHVQKRMYSPM